MHRKFARRKYKIHFELGLSKTELESREWKIEYLLRTFLADA